MRLRSTGFSLIEMMIALVLGVILILGLVQVFAASRASYALSEGLSRVQENGRFAMDYLQRDLRMVGHFGCANDQFRLQKLGILTSHVGAVPAHNFLRSIEGYEATGTAPGNTVNLLSDGQLASPGSWAGTPALPSFVSGLARPPLPGSDVIVVRYLSGEGVPVTGIAGSTISFDAARWSTLTSNGVAAPTVFGIADCTYADIFQDATAAAGTVTAPASLSLASRYTVHPAGQTMLYRAEAVAYYVARGAGGGPSLWRARYLTNGAADPEELVEGVENLQLIYGQDPGPVTALTGHITAQYVASSPELGAVETNWRRVGQVRIGLVVRSPDRAAASQRLADLNVLGTTLKAPNAGQDTRYRATYESTVALRNRLYSTQ